MVLGCNGMAGHMISLFLKQQGHSVTGFARQKSLFVDTIIGDALNFNCLQNVLEHGNYDIVVNCIGILNQSAEQNHTLAILLNSYLPHYLVQITKKMKTRIIHISTDCVFSGTKGKYTEQSVPDGISFYDRTKALGEIDDDKNLTLRTSIVGPDLKPSGIGLLNWFLQQKEEVNGFARAFWTGQTTLQLAKTIEAAVQSHAYGLYNAVPETSISKYELLGLFNKYIRETPIKINKNTDIVLDKSLIRKRWDNFDYVIPTYKDMVQELGDFMKNHRELYPQYQL